MKAFFAALGRLGRLSPRTGASTFRSDRRGSMATWLGLSLVPLLVFAGAGLDLGRSVNQKAQLQGAVDAAALAGASAYTSTSTSATAVAAATNYMEQFKTASGLAVTYTITPATALNGTTITLYKMTVTASAPISNSIMAINRASNTISVRAVAQNPVYNITINLSSFSSSALDYNFISYYIVPPDGSTPSPTSTTLIYSNYTNSNPSSTTIQMTASQRLGFLLSNVTGGRAGYGSNGYGGSQGSVHYFWSHLSPPSKQAYPSLTTDCSLQVATTNANPTQGCLTKTPANATVNCVQASGQTLYFAWNDMGGPGDDRDFNDANYRVTCAKVDSTVSKGMVLTN